MVCVIVSPPPGGVFFDRVFFLVRFVCVCVRGGSIFTPAPLLHPTPEVDVCPRILVWGRGCRRRSKPADFGMAVCVVLSLGVVVDYLRMLLY